VGSKQPRAAGKAAYSLPGSAGRSRLSLKALSNPSYSPIDIGGEEETRNVRILGKAVAVRFCL